MKHLAWCLTQSKKLKLLFSLLESAKKITTGKLHIGGFYWLSHALLLLKHLKSEQTSIEKNKKVLEKAGVGVWGEPSIIMPPVGEFQDRMQLGARFHTAP